MSRKEAIDQYAAALKAGKNYYRLAVSRGEYPYPPVLDNMLHPDEIVDRVNLGVINIPTELIAGTKTEGRVSALAGNFMPLLGEATEFATKWTDLCEAHLGDEGIRDPIKCFEYLGRFYVQEGNKRTSVLMSYGAPSIPGSVTRLLPARSDDPVVRQYYEFLDFYALAGIYGIVLRYPGAYAKLQASLGMDPQQVWTEEERRRFQAAYSFFRTAYNRVWKNREKDDATPAEALLVWLEFFTLSDIRDLSSAKLDEELAALLPNIRQYIRRSQPELVTEDERQPSLLTKLMQPLRDKHVSAAFIYDRSGGTWVRSHEHGREYVAEKLGNIVDARPYVVTEDDAYATMQQAVAEGADVIFATSPTMIDACRKMALLNSNVKVLNCSLSMPYTGVRSYYGRLYECKFVTGAIAGAMSENDVIGYIANFPVYGTFAGINAFARGARLTNPRARIQLKWSCLPGNPLKELVDSGVKVISNKDASNLKNPHWDLEWGTYKLNEDGSMLPLAVPGWNFGSFYVSILRSISEGTWQNLAPDEVLNYWWGMKSGMIDLQFSDSIPEGVRFLADYLREGIISGRVEPFRARIIDQAGVLRNTDDRSMDAKEIMHMDWLCDNVEGSIPEFDDLKKSDRDVVRILGVYRSRIPPEKEAAEL